MAETDVPRVDEPDRTEEGTDRPTDADWEENEPSPHEGEEEQEIA